jgi:glycosyltransferase involved in cell wall biosynthesis
VILCGPFLVEGVIGGYGRCNELTASSPYLEAIGIQRLPITVPGDGSYVRRMAVDLERTWRCLRDVPAPIFHLTAQYHWGTYREYLQYRMARRAGRRFVYDIRAGNFKKAFDGSTIPLERRMLREMLFGADAITVEGRRELGWIADSLGREAVYFPNIVQLKHRDDHPRAALEPRRVGERLRLVYSGRLAPEKGLEELLNACAMLESRGIEVMLNLLGSGDAGYEERLRRLATENLPSDRVVFKGVLDHQALLAFLATQHIFTFPTRWDGEGHSNALNEAMQIGLPIVTTQQGFLGDVVTAECGAVLPSPVPDALARVIAELQSDWERLRACGAAAHERVYREFSDATVFPRLVRLYESLGALPASASPA